RAASRGERCWARRCRVYGYETCTDSARSMAAASPDGSAWRSCGSWYENRYIPESAGAVQCAPPPTRVALLWPHTPHRDGVASSSAAETHALASQDALPCTQAEASRALRSSWHRRCHWDYHRDIGVDALRILHDLVYVILPPSVPWSSRRR